MSTERVLAFIDSICGAPDEAAERAFEVINAHAVTLRWVRDTTGIRPAPDLVLERLRAADAKLRTREDDRDPETALMQVAVTALAELGCDAS